MRVIFAAQKSAQVFRGITGGLLGLWLGLASPGHGATLTITSLNNSGPNTLRTTIQAAAPGDVIVFGVSGYITLTSGEIPINKSLTILGPPAGIFLDGHTNGRIFSISAGTVILSNLSFLNGQVQGADGTLGTPSHPQGGPGQTTLGGAISNAATLTLYGCTFLNNVVLGGTGGLDWAATSTGGTGGAGEGGAIFNLGNLSLLNCTFTGNFATGGRGGAGNTGGNGGAGFGGAVHNAGTLSMANCTLSRNYAIGAQGGNGGSVNSHGGQGGNSYGGGLAQAGTGFLRNNILAVNFSAFGLGGNAASGGTPGSSGFATGPDVYNAVSSQGHNLVGQTDGSTGWQASDLKGTSAVPLDPVLGGLLPNGGPTATMAPLPGSPAIEAGDDAVLGAPYNLATDQRGRPRSIGAHVDIGSVEYGPVSWTVLNTADHGAGSLRQAILDAYDGDRIGFAPTVTGVITLTSGPIGIAKGLDITGPGAKVLAISGNNASRVLEVLSGFVNLTGLTIRNGNAVGATGGFEQTGADGRGGGIFNQATLTLTDCMLLSNSVSGGQGGPTDSGSAGSGGNGFGGGIANIGSLTLLNCTIAGNSVQGGAGGVATAGGSNGTHGQGLGGGLYSSVSSLVVYSCTLANNRASGSGFDVGGGICDDGSGGAYRNSTIAANVADFGGGLYATGNGPAPDVGNTLFGQNSATYGSADLSGTIHSSDYNFIQNTSGYTLSGTTTHNVSGQNPSLGPLQDNSGPTLTMALLTGSPAIDKGKSFGFSADQRYQPRPYDFTAIANAAGGDGSDIGAFELGPPVLQLTSLPAALVLSWPTNYASYVMQVSSDLKSSLSWSNLAVTPSVSGSQFVVTNPIGPGIKFFRLKGP